MLLHTRPLTQELSVDARLVTRSAFLRTEPVHGAPDVWVLVPALPNAPSTFNIGFARRLAARQALPLAEWDPQDPVCAARKPPVAAPPPMRDPQPSSAAGAAAPSASIPALGGGGGSSTGFIPALGGGPGHRGGGPGPRSGAGMGSSGGGAGDGGSYAQGGGSYGPGAGGGPGSDSNTAQVLAAVARVLRSKVASVPRAFGESVLLFGAHAWLCCLDHRSHLGSARFTHACMGFAHEQLRRVCWHTSMCLRHMPCLTGCCRCVCLLLRRFVTVVVPCRRRRQQAAECAP